MFVNSPKIWNIILQIFETLRYCPRWRLPIHQPESIYNIFSCNKSKSLNKSFSFLCIKYIQCFVSESLFTLKRVNLNYGLAGREKTLGQWRMFLFSDIFAVFSQLGWCKETRVYYLLFWFSIFYHLLFASSWLVQGDKSTCIIIYNLLHKYLSWGWKSFLSKSASQKRKTCFCVAQIWIDGIFLPFHKKLRQRIILSQNCDFC